ncbi:MAG TPA: hypothetical protein QGF35_06070 [Dehalococcoidia bacterium]|nr:hypothetical protein [Dehalococcoidia bacterium]
MFAPSLNVDLDQLKSDEAKDKGKTAKKATRKGARARTKKSADAKK